MKNYPKETFNATIGNTVLAVRFLSRKSTPKDADFPR